MKAIGLAAPQKGWLAKHLVGVEKGCQKNVSSLRVRPVEVFFFRFD
jgi:hypothetical protein